MCMRQDVHRHSWGYPRSPKLSEVCRTKSIFKKWRLLDKVGENKRIREGSRRENKRRKPTKCHQATFQEWSCVHRREYLRCAKPTPDLASIELSVIPKVKLTQSRTVLRKAEKLKGFANP